MDAAYIVPFINSIQNVFATMMQLPVATGAPRIKEPGGASFDVSGVIGMSGDVIGSVVLSFPLETAERVVAKFTGSKVESTNPDFADAVGELVNMISGGAKGLFGASKKVSISCPSVIIGHDHVVQQRRDIPCIVIPCTTDCGELAIELAIRPVVAGEQAPSTRAAKAA